MRRWVLTLLNKTMGYFWKRGWGQELSPEENNLTQYNWNIIMELTALIVVAHENIIIPQINGFHSLPGLAHKNLTSEHINFLKYVLFWSHQGMVEVSLVKGDKLISVWPSFKAFWSALRNSRGIRCLTSRSQAFLEPSGSFTRDLELLFMYSISVSFDIYTMTLGEIQNFLA